MASLSYRASYEPICTIATFHFAWQLSSYEEPSPPPAATAPASFYSPYYGYDDPHQPPTPDASYTHYLASARVSLASRNSSYGAMPPPSVYGGEIDVALRLGE
jgi:hypothetical protein